MRTLGENVCADPARRGFSGPPLPEFKSIYKAFSITCARPVLPSVGSNAVTTI